MPAQRQASTEEEAPIRRRADGHLPVVEPDALADPDEPVAAAVAGRAARAIAGRGTPAIVAYLDAELIRGVPERYHRLGGTGVLERVGEAFLNDPVGRDIHATRQREAVAGDLQPHGQPGTPDLLQQAVETVEPRLRRQARI